MRRMFRLPAVLRLAACFGFLLAGGTVPAASAVRLNELMYHPPGDRDELQWIELHNASTNTVDLAGWSFQKGLTFTFPASTRLAPGGFVVVARQRDAFLRHYGASPGPVLGDFRGRLSHSGEAVELTDAAGAVVDTVRYRDSAPWPVSPDGMSPSLERISCLDAATEPWNWAPSALPATRHAAGSPGQTNSVARPGLPPIVESLEMSAWQDGQPMRFTARLSSTAPAERVVLEYLTIPLASAPEANPANAARPWTPVTMPKTPEGAYVVSLPSLPTGHLLRARVVARGTTGLERIHPHPNDARPSLSAYLGSNTNDARIGFLSLHEFGPRESRGQSTQDFFQNSERQRPGRAAPPPPARGQSVAIFSPTKRGPVQVFDHVRITPRKGGWKVRLHKDLLLEGMSTVNVIFEEQPRHVLSEHLAYELFREAKVPTPLSGHWRVWHNSRPLGYHLYVEQINGSFTQTMETVSIGPICTS